MSKIHMPEVAELGEQLRVLLGRTTKATEAGSPHIFEDSCHTARYLTRDDQLVVLCQVDLTVAAAMGASLAMIPASAAEEAIKDGDLGENLTDAYCEVANIMASLLCKDGYPHVRWVSIEKSIDALSESDKAILASPSERIDIEVEFEGYGGGKMSIITIDTK